MSESSSAPPGYDEHAIHHEEHDENLPPTVSNKLNLFLDNTTAHGAKRIRIAHNNFARYFWIFLMACGFCTLIFVLNLLVAKYQSHDKITSIEIKFDHVEFPAITFCNLNPYKKSLVMMVPSIRDTMDVYDNAKSSSKSNDPRKKKPKISRKQQMAMAQARVLQLFAKEIEEGQEELKRQRAARWTTPLLMNQSYPTAMAPRSKRQALEDFSGARYEAIEAHCKCIGKLDMECIRFESAPKNDKSKCVCTFDRDMMVAWPCFNSTIWYDHVCPLCHKDGFCEPTAPPGTIPDELDCKCRNRTGVGTKKEDTPYCVIKPEAKIRKLWLENNVTEEPTEPPTTTTTTTTITTTTTSRPPTTTTPKPTTTTTSTTTTSTTPSTTTTTTTTTLPPVTARPNQRAIVSAPETIKAMGFAGMTDAVAMLTKAKENLMFTMAALSEDQRVALSQQKHEFIEMCSFNGKECNIEEDFRRHVDPEFGNCYTFNYDVSNNYTSSRAGPMYGIRVLLFVNTSDYMSTSESAGVRIAIHSPTEFPFPDTFGYSAPVGFASSFGIKKKIIKRLSIPPHGDCVVAEELNSTGYIYAGYDYHPEGCHRSCFQNSLLNACSCGDPRFPILSGDRHCSAFNATARDCLENHIGSVGDFHHITDQMSSCTCKHSCQEEVYEVTFSASKWPSGATDLGDCEGMTETECEEYYKLNAAMVEIFYEQLNYELLQESEAYAFVNLIADFGGHLGLWLGFSVITLIEVAVLLIDMIVICCQNRKNRKLQRMETLRSINAQQHHPKDKSLIQI